MNELKFGAVMESLVISLHVAIPNSQFQGNAPQPPEGNTEVNEEVTGLKKQKVGQSGAEV